MATARRWDRSYRARSGRNSESPSDVVGCGRDRGWGWIGHSGVTHDGVGCPSSVVPGSHQAAVPLLGRPLSMHVGRDPLVVPRGKRWCQLTLAPIGHPMMQEEWALPHSRGVRSSRRSGRRGKFFPRRRRGRLRDSVGSDQGNAVMAATRRKSSFSAFGPVLVVL